MIIEREPDYYTYRNPLTAQMRKELWRVVARYDSEDRALLDSLKAKGRRAMTEDEEFEWDGFINNIAARVTLGHPRRDSLRRDRDFLLEIAGTLVSGPKVRR